MSRIYYNPDFGTSVYREGETDLYIVIYGMGTTTRKFFMDESLAIDFANAPFDYLED